MQKPTSEPDYTINLEAIKAIIEAAGNGPFIHRITHKPGGDTHAIFDADGYKCADRLSEHFATAITTALNFGPEIIDMLIELEKALLALDAYADIPNHEKDRENEVGVSVYVWDRLMELAERIKAGREAQS